jgi:RNase P/RNase MRP subunit p29
MIDDKQLDEYRVNGTKIRVVRDANEANDVRGFVVAWDGESVLIRKQNRKVVKLPRTYLYQPADMERPQMD